MMKNSIYRHIYLTFAIVILVAGFCCIAYSAMTSSSYEAVAITGTSGKLTGLSSTTYSGQAISGQTAIGTVSSGATLRDSQFGFLYLLTTGASQIVQNYEIYDIQAFSHSTGEEISSTTWQVKNDPYFVWKIKLLSEPVIILGYSVSLDSEPDDTIDTAQTFYDGFLVTPISDGKHKFYVKAATTGEVWGEPEDFEFWVDSTKPAASDLTPMPGVIVTESRPLISVKLQDANSGIQLDTIKLSIDDKSFSFEYDGGLLSCRPSSALSDGSRTVKVQVEDFAGNLLDMAWGFIVDANKPTGSIAINGADDVTGYARVRLNLEAQDNTTQVAEMIISNDGIFDTEKWEGFQSVRTDWILDTPQKIGKKTVYCMFKDEAGNISHVYKDSINLISPSIDTVITMGPYSPIKDTNANFVYQASMEDSKFSYKLDDADWSEWSDVTTTSFSNLLSGNHVFSAKAAKDLNKDNLISEDEEDPIPAQWTWVITSTEPEAEKREKILYWRTE